MNRKILIITGMHRSGTSLVSQYLSKCGLDVGKELINLDSISSDSAFNGHHEDKDFLYFHESLLKKSVKIPFKKANYAFPTSEFALPLFIGQKEKLEAERIIQKRAKLEQWGWKDPRTSLFLDFWEQILDRPKYLFLFRHPLTVADSVVRRGADKIVMTRPEIAIKTWILFNKKILAFQEKHEDRCIVLNIQDIIESPLSLCQTLQKKFGLNLKVVDFETVYKKKSLKQESTDLAKLYSFDTKHKNLYFKSTEIYGKLQKISDRFIHEFEPKI